MAGEDFNIDVEGNYEGVDFEAIAAEELDRAAVRTVNEWQDNMDEADYRNTGDTINSITWERPEQLRRVIGSDRMAALIGEVGRAPGAGFPPAWAIADWVHEMGDMPDRGDPDFDGVVFQVQRAIHENGLPAHRFGERAAKTVGEQFGLEMTQALQEEIERQDRKHG